MFINTNKRNKHKINAKFYKPCLFATYCEYLGSSGGYGSSGGVPEVRESGMEVRGGVRKFGSLLFFNHFKKFAPEGQIF